MTNTFFDGIILSEAIKALPANVPTTWDLDYQGTTNRHLSARRSPNGWMRVWETPQHGRHYLVSLVNGALGVWRQGTWDPIKGDMPTRLAAASIEYSGVHATHITEWAAAISTYYGSVPIAVDVESMPGVVDRLKALGAPVLARRQSADRRRVGQAEILRHPGFEINPEVRIESYVVLQQAWRDGQVIIHDPMTLQQMGGIIVGDSETPDLMDGHKENWVKMAALGVWQIGQAASMRLPGPQNPRGVESNRVLNSKRKLY